MLQKMAPLLLLLLLLLVIFSVPVTATSSTNGAMKTILNKPPNTSSMMPPTVTFSVNKGVAHAFLIAHNKVRATFGERPLRWDKKLARFARRWASRMRADCNLTHSNGPYGENIFIGLGKYTIREAVDEWAKERWYYHWGNNSCNPDQMCGHFTQMIWNETEAVGCARLKCNNASFTFHTCNYDPPGNYIGRRPVLDYQKFVAH